MGPRWRKRAFRPKHRIQDILLDKFSIRDIRKWNYRKEEILKYHWDYYSNLAYQRSKITGKIRNSLLEVVIIDFNFKHWQRVVKYKYSLEPLSIEGSLVDPGSRFNIGNINPSQFPPFPALYIAKDKLTALQEVLCQNIDPLKSNQAHDIALTNPSSITNISLSGCIASVIDLRDRNTLKGFVNLIKNFNLPKDLINTAKKAGLKPPELVKKTSVLIDTLLDPNWRISPMQFDIPANSQIFGQLVYNAGIEGIIYPSKFSGNDCIAVFPQNFDEYSGSFIQLDDEAPSEIRTRKLNYRVWNNIQDC